MDNLTPEQRRNNMQKIRSTGTKPEKLLMNALREKGLVFICYDKALIGKPDIVFPECKLSVFIDSDFWHGNPRRFVRPKTNTDYWDKKIAGNKKRDCLVNRQLRKQGWTVLRVWDYDIKHDLDSCVEKIIKQCQKSCALLEKSRDT